MNAKDSSHISRNNWSELEAMNDEAIDYSDIPPLTEEFFEKATLRIPLSQTQRLVRIDQDILNWFKSQGKEYQASINSVLRRYMEKSDKQLK